MTTPQTRAARDPLIAERFAAGDDVQMIAAQFGVTDRTVCRALVRTKARPPRAERLRTDAERVLEVLADGMPANWAAETLRLNYEPVARLARQLPNRRRDVSEWQRVWGEIRNSSALLALHYEFAPRT